LRREHDDESGNTRHDDTGQRHGRRGNAGRIASIAIGMLRGKLASRCPRAKRPMRQINAPNFFSAVRRIMPLV
jgi:hypothetical protein